MTEDHDNGKNEGAPPPQQPRRGMETKEGSQEFSKRGSYYVPSANLTPEEVPSFDPPEASTSPDSTPADED